MHLKDNKGMPKGKKIDNSWSTCALCGKIYKNTKLLKAKIGGYEYLFDSSNCITIFKKLANMYGHEFKTLSAKEQYVYSPKWESIVPREQEFGKMKSKMGQLKMKLFRLLEIRFKYKSLFSS